MDGVAVGGLLLKHTAGKETPLIGKNTCGNREGDFSLAENSVEKRILRMAASVSSESR